MAERFHLDQVRVAGRLTIAARLGSGITAVMGPSGAGKSTLCALLSGALQPDSGMVRRTLEPAGLALFTAGPGSLWPQITVADHLRLVRPAGARDELLAELGLAHRADARPHQLSTGECERLGVARALASGARMLVLDEPFAHVDPALAERCWAVLWARVAASGAELVYATHEPERVIGRAQRILVLAEGGLAWAGAVDDLYHRPPNAALASVLGQGTWLTAEDAAFLSLVPGCLRPERLAIIPDPAGPHTVAASEFRGAVTVTTLTGSPVALRHRATAALAVGTRVAIQALALVLVLLLAGCGDAEPVLTVTTQRAWNLPGVNAQQPSPRGLGRAADGGVLVLDTAGRVLDHAPDGTLRRQWTMPQWDAGRPEGITTLRDGRMVVPDTHYHRLVWFRADGSVEQITGSEGDGPGQFRWPVGATVDGDGNLWISEYGGNDRLQQFAPDGTFMKAVGTFGTGPGQFQRPQSLCWSGDRLYVADTMNNRIVMLGSDGRDLGVLGATALSFPYGISPLPDGSLMVAEYAAGRLTRLSRDGTLLGRRPGFLTPWSCVVAGDGAVWVADTGNRQVVRVVLGR